MVTTHCYLRWCNLGSPYKDHIEKTMRRRAITIPYLKIDNLKNHTLSGGTYLSNPYMGVTPPPSRSLLNISCESLSRKLWSNCKQDHRNLCLGHNMYVCILTQCNFFGGFDQTKACLWILNALLKLDPLTPQTKNKSFWYFSEMRCFQRKMLYLLSQN